ncbi:MAG: CSLREA domain-containing protein [Anaerolineales bacterium]|nr:CSLREA domain-containing protein [Anaerolineales bacterium]
MKQNSIQGRPSLPVLILSTALLGCLGLILFLSNAATAVAAPNNHDILSGIHRPEGITAPLATFTVNSLADNGDAALNGICADSFGNCTLRAAIAEANFNDDVADTIDFSVSGTIYLNTSLEINTSNLTITATQGSITLTKAVAAGDFNAINVGNATNDATNLASHIVIHGLTITGMTGNSVNAGNGIRIFRSYGTGISNYIEYCTISNNERDGVLSRIGTATNYIIYSTVADNGRFGVYADGKNFFATVIAVVTLQNNGYAAVGTNISLMWVTGNDILDHPLVFEQQNAADAYEFIAYANNIDTFSTSVNITGTRNTFLGHNWWTNGITTGLTITEWQRRLGAPVVSWLDGWGDTTLGNARLHSPSAAGPSYPARDVSVIVNHGRANYPFGNGTMGHADNMCSDYYDFFVVHTSSSIAPANNWTVSLPVDDNTNCNLNTRDPEKLFRVTNINECSPASNPACWDLVPGSQVSVVGQNLEATPLTAAELQGTPFVAGSAGGYDPTAVSIASFVPVSQEQVASLLPWLGAFVLLGAITLHIALSRRQNIFGEKK